MPLEIGCHPLRGFTIFSVATSPGFAALTGLYAFVRSADSFNASRTLSYSGPPFLTERFPERAPVGKNWA